MNLPAVQERNPLTHIKINKEEVFPRTLKEYTDNERKNIPEFDMVWSEIWVEEYAHGVKVNEDGVYVDRMPERVAKLMYENLITGYAPKQMGTRVPILSLYALGIYKISSAYTAEQQEAFAKFYRDVRTPFFRSLIAEFQSRFPHAWVIVIPDGHHYCFMAQKELVRDEMRKFLLE
jgi:hypothetical protein